MNEHPRPVRPRSAITLIWVVAACLCLGAAGVGFAQAAPNATTTPQPNLPQTPSTAPRPPPAAPKPPQAAAPGSAAPAAPRTAAPGPAASPSLTVPLTPQAPTNDLHLSAVYGSDNQPVKAGLHWRVFNERAEDDGSHALVAQSTDPSPTVALPDGDYIVHAAFGLAGQTKRVVMAGHPELAKVALNAGALKINGVIGTTPIPPNRLSIAVYVPERGNAEAKLVVDNASAGEVLLLPEGSYHIVSTYLDTVGIGSVQQTAQSGHLANASNSVVTTDIKVQTGKMMDVTLRHRAAVLTLKLVNGPNGEALTDTQFTVLTPGGDVIRELIGAFPSLVLAEGQYIAIARHGGTTYQANFNVQSGQDRDVEIIGQ